MYNICKKMSENRFDDLDVEDQKGGIRGGVYRTAACPGERCRRDRPSGQAYTPSERVSTEIIIELRGECGLAASLEWEERCGAAVPDPARAIVAVAPHSGDSLHAVPCSLVVARLYDTSLRVAVSLYASRCNNRL